jgi:hypothetical protein
MVPIIGLSFDLFCKLRRDIYLLGTIRLTTECSATVQLIERIKVGSPGRIRTYSLSVNSREDQKSKCPIWCRLREIGSHFSFFSCTHTCTHPYDSRMQGNRSALRLVEVADPLSLPTRRLRSSRLFVEVTSFAVD